MFLDEFEDKVSELQRLLVLDEALKTTPAPWWVTHKKLINGWSQCQILMTVRFSEAEEYHVERYDGRNDPGGHVIECYTLWAS